MNPQNGRPKGRPATPEQFRLLFNELSLLYLEYWSFDRVDRKEALRAEVIDRDGSFPTTRRWYTTLLQSLVPIWTPSTKTVSCWWLPGVALETEKTRIYLYLDIATGEPYVMFSGEPVADRFVPEELSITLTVNDLKTIIDRVKSEQVQVQALIATKEHS